MIFSLTGPTHDDQLFHDFEIAEPVDSGREYHWTPIRGLIDTGAQHSHIASTVATRLTLPLLGTSTIAGVHAQPIQVEVRRIITRWTSCEGNTIIKPFQMMVGMGIDPAKAEALIGMDMIKHFRLTVSFARAYTLVGDFDLDEFSS